MFLGVLDLVLALAKLHHKGSGTVDRKGVPWGGELSERLLARVRAAELLSAGGCHDRNGRL